MRVALVYFDANANLPAKSLRLQPWLPGPGLVVTAETETVRARMPSLIPASPPGPVHRPAPAGAPPVHMGPPPAVAAADTALRDQLAQLELKNAELTEAQSALAANVEALQLKVEQLVEVTERVQARQELTPALPLPLARFGTLITEPGPSIAFLRELVRLGIATATVLEQDASGQWRPRARRRQAARNIAREMMGLVFGQRGVVYRVAAPKAPAAVRPRVLHIIPNVFVGGSTQLVIDLMERMGHLYEMQVVTAALPKNGRHEGMDVSVLPLGSAPEAFAEAFARIRPDLIHMHYWGGSDRPWYLAALAAARADGAPLIQNVNTPVEPLRDDVVRTYVFVSQYIRDVFAPDIANGEVIHPGIDLDRFTPTGFAPGAEATIGMVYRLTRDKLDETSIEPLVDVALRRPKARILVIGNGDLLPVYLARVEAAGVRDNFEFAGTVPYAELPKRYRQFRIFVAPVVRESFGQVTPFAMAMGQAVAGFKVGALPEILGGEKTLGAGRTELADILVALLDDAAERDALGAANAARARMFTVDGMISRYSKVYAQSLGRDVEAGFPA